MISYWRKPITTLLVSADCSNIMGQLKQNINILVVKILMYDTFQILKYRGGTVVQQQLFNSKRNSWKDIALKPW